MITYVARNQCGARLCVCVWARKSEREIRYSTHPLPTLLSHSSIGWFPPRETTARIQSAGELYRQHCGWRWCRWLCCCCCRSRMPRVIQERGGDRWFAPAVKGLHSSSLQVISPFFGTRMWLRNDVLPWWRWEIIKEHQLLACCLPRRFTQTCGSQEVAYLSLHLYF